MTGRRGVAGWTRALLVLALLAGLVAMHQMVDPGMSGSSATEIAAAMDPGYGHDAADQNAPGHEMPAGHGSMLEHLCLAVLVALATLAAAAVVLLLVAPTRTPGAARAPTPVLAGPAPVPVPRRLAALQVLRL